jgi:chaperonin cofactor prefoldin
LRSKDRFEALVRDRDSLRAEVTDMRKSLEEIQSKHQTDMEALQTKLDDAESKKEHAESQFRGLLERVNTIKSQLGERLKEDAVRTSLLPFLGTCANIVCRRKLLKRGQGLKN